MRKMHQRGFRAETGVPPPRLGDGTPPSGPGFRSFAPHASIGRYRKPVFRGSDTHPDMPVNPGRLGPCLHLCRGTSRRDPKRSDRLRGPGDRPRRGGPRLSCSPMLGQDLATLQTIWSGCVMVWSARWTRSVASGVGVPMGGPGPHSRAALRGGRRKALGRLRPPEPLDEDRGKEALFALRRDADAPVAAGPFWRRRCDPWSVFVISGGPKRPLTPSSASAQCYASKGGREPPAPGLCHDRQVGR